MTNMKKNIGLMIGAIVLISGITFFAGFLYGQKKKTATIRFNPPSAQGRNFQGNNGNTRQNGAGFINGEILNSGDNSLTIKLIDGGSKIILLSASTTVNKMAAGTLADLAIGTDVSVIGKTNSDGSVSATAIQIRPEPPLGATQKN